jgi:hypothetical protein
MVVECSGHQHISVAIATISRVIIRILGIQTACQNSEVNHSMLQRMSETIYSHQISANLLLKWDIISFKKTKTGCIFYVVSVYIVSLDAYIQGSVLHGHYL